MKRDWDLRSRRDAMWYIASARRDWTQNEFFLNGEEQVEKILTHFFKPLKFDPEKRVMLDIGCGIGRMTFAFAKTFQEVHGTDISPEMLTKADEKAQNYTNVFLSLGNGKDLGQYDSHFFDFCFSHLVFMHIPDENIIFEYIIEIGRILKPGGLFRFDLSNYRMDNINRKIYEVIAKIYKKLGLRVNISEKRMLDHRNKIFQFETIKGAAIQREKLKSVLHSANLEPLRITGQRTRIMLVEGRKKA